MITVFLHLTGHNKLQYLNPYGALKYEYKYTQLQFSHKIDDFLGTLCNFFTFNYTERFQEEQPDLHDAVKNLSSELVILNWVLETIR